MEKTFVLITGACSGLGRAFARQCALKGMHLLLIDRPAAGSILLAQRLTQVYDVDVHTFEFDMTDTLQMYENLQYIAANFQVSFIINNAGVGGTRSIEDAPVEYIDSIINLNVRSTALLTRMLIPSLRKHSRSYILNVSSMAAFTPLAYKTVYPASKAFISSFSMGLRQELIEYGVSVSVLYPGPIMTNSSVSRRIIGLGSKGRLGLLSTDEIAAIAIPATLKGKTKIIPGRTNQVNHFLMSLLPTAFKLRLISNEIRKEIGFAS